MPNDSEARLAALGLTLPDAPAPAANYVPFQISDKLLFIAGQVSAGADGGIKGTLGADLTVENGQNAAQLACLNVLAQAKAALGSLDRIGQNSAAHRFRQRDPRICRPPERHQWRLGSAR